jgi:hypothetical protein
MVSRVTSPSVGATQRYQIELVAGDPAWFGSPGSAVASVLSFVTEPQVPVITWAAAQLSLAGWADTPPANPSHPAIITGTTPASKKVEIFNRELRINIVLNRSTDRIIVTGYSYVQKRGQSKNSP